MAKVKYTIDPKNPPETPKEDLARFDSIMDDEIDYSDIPEIGDEVFEKPKKQSVTMRLDADMVRWFQAQGKGYQTRMNAVLRAFYERHRH